MNSFRRPLLLFALLLPPTASLGQGSPAKPTADYSGEAIVIQQKRTATRFENDGTARRTLAVRVLVKTEAGVRALGLLRFGYDSATEKLTVDRVEVHKPDGSVVPADTSSIQDLASPLKEEV